MVHDVKRLLTIGLILGSFLFFLPSSRAATVTPEALTRQLMAAFSTQPDDRPSPSASIEEKRYVGLRMRTVVFAIGARAYRIVFSSAGTVTVAVTSEGSLVAHPIWEAKTNQTTIEEIVNIVYGREFGRRYDPSSLAVLRKGPEADESATKEKELRNDGRSALRWNRLMNSILRGDSVASSGDGGGSGGGGGNFGRAAAEARASDPCSGGENGTSPQQAVMTSIAEAMSTLPAKKGGVTRGLDDLFSDRSRKFERKGRSDLFEEVDEFGRRPQPEEAFRLIQQSASDAYALFRTALDMSDEHQRDPYALAALRNFRTVARDTGIEKGEGLVDQVLAKTVIDIDRFTALRRLAPDSAVIFDRESERYYVDPTLTSPSEARFLLSLAVFYEWKLSNPQALSFIRTYNELRREIVSIERAILDESDETKLATLRSQADDISARLFLLSEQLRTEPSLPTL